MNIIGGTVPYSVLNIVSSYWHPSSVQGSHPRHSNGAKVDSWYCSHGSWRLRPWSSSSIRKGVYRYIYIYMHARRKNRMLGFDPETVAAYSGIHNERVMQIYACKKESHVIECVTEILADCCCMPMDPTLNADTYRLLWICTVHIYIYHVHAAMSMSMYVCTEHVHLMHVQTLLLIITLHLIPLTTLYTPLWQNGKQQM